MMNQYEIFLNAIGTYLDLLMLEEKIQIYKKMMDNNRDEKEVYKNLKNAMLDYQSEKSMLLGNSQIEKMREDILDMWSSIQNDLLELPILYHSKVRKRGLPLYAIVQEIVKYDLTFLDMYQFLIQNNLYHPNFAYGTSDEPFFSLLPDDPINCFYQLNMLVIQNPQMDFHILNNGSDIIKDALYYLSDSQDEVHKNYWKDYIMAAVKGNCSLLDSRHYHGVSNYEMEPSIFQVMNHPELEEIQSYLLSEQGISKQIENSLYPSLERDKAIDFYIERINNISILEKLKILKK